MDQAIETLIGELHAVPHKMALAAAGAGSSALSWLLGVSGASRTLLEARVPYGRRSMIDLVGGEPAQYVSPPTARAMARAAYRRGLALLEDDSPVAGVACTAAIATDRPRRGDHRACIAVWDARQVTTYNLLLDKGKRDRPGEEAAVSRLLVHAIAHAFGVAASLELGLAPSEQPATETLEHPDPVQRLLSGDVDLVLVDRAGSAASIEAGQLEPRAVLPGSFRPLHYGHAQLARAASEMTGLETVYELSAVNVDKPPLTGAEIARRLAAMTGQASVALTRAPTFRLKADRFPGSVFVVGWDTAARLVDPRYYGGEAAVMLRALAEIWARDCRFLVAGRVSGGIFCSLPDIAIPEGFRPMFQEIPEARFRADVSSTALRNQGG